MAAYRTARRHLDRLIVTVSGSGSAATDTTNFAAAVTMCNAEWSAKSRASTIEVDGVITLNANQALSGPVSLIGTSPDAQINFESSGGSLISWNSVWLPTDETHFNCYVTAGEQRVYHTGGASVPSQGDWIVLWSEDQLDVEPHLGTGHGQHPMELHQVEYVDGSTIFVNGFVADDMTQNALARGVVVPSTVWSQGVTVDNLILNWTGGTPSDYTSALVFHCCENVSVTDRVQTTRDGPGAIWFDFCANSVCRAKVNGIAKDDNMYATVAASVNGMHFDCQIRGTRHAFTTTSSMSVDTAHTVTSVQVDPVNTLTSASHGLVDGQCVNISGTPPTGLSIQTAYWVVNATTDTVQLAATPGGAPITLTSTGSSVVIDRESRWGTPRGVVWDGIVHASPLVTAGPTYSSRIAWDTHAEGYGIVCRADFVLTGGFTAESYAAQSRARSTVFKGCTIEGGTDAGGIGIRLLGKDCRVEDCSIDGVWRGVLIDDVRAGGVEPSGCAVTGTIIKNATSHGVIATSGNNHEIHNSVFQNCGSTAGNSPFASKSILRIDEGTGHTITNNYLAKGSNDFAIDTYQLASSAVTIANNTLTGYGDAGIGRSQGFTAAVDNVLTMTAGLTHGLNSGDTVVLTTDGTLPAPLATGTTYYVLVQTTTTIKLEASLGGGEIDITDTGTGNHFIEAASRQAIEDVVVQQNTTDSSGKGVVSVLDYGADATGAVSSAAAFQQALNTGNNVYVPVGTYLIDTTLTLAADGQCLYGDGIFKCRITTTVTGSAATIDTNSKVWVELRNLSIYGQTQTSPYQATVGVHFDGSARARLHNVMVRYCATGIHLQNSWILQGDFVWARDCTLGFNAESMNDTVLGMNCANCTQDFTIDGADGSRVDFLREGAPQTTSSTIDDAKGLTFSKFYSESSTATTVDDVVIGGTTGCIGLAFHGIKAARQNSEQVLWAFDDVSGVYIGHGEFLGGTAGAVYSTTSDSDDIVSHLLTTTGSQGSMLPPPTHSNQPVWNMFGDPKFMRGIPTFDASADVTIGTETTTVPDGMSRSISMAITGAGDYAYGRIDLDLTQYPYTELRGDTVGVGTMIYAPISAAFGTNTAGPGIHLTVDGTGGGSSTTHNRDYIPGKWVQTWNEVAVPSDATTLQVFLYANNSADDKSGETVYFGEISVWRGGSRNKLKFYRGELQTINLTTSRYIT